MTGFFTQAQLDTSAAITRVADGTECHRCGLFHKSNGLTRFPHIGEGAKGILIVLDCATNIESNRKKQLVGGAPYALAVMLRKYGVNLLKDCWVVRAVRCVPPYTKGMPDVTDTQISNCSIRLEETLRELSPKTIVVMGDIAVSAIMRGRVSGVSTTVLRGLQIPDQHYKAWILSTFSLEYMRLKENDDNLRSVIERDLREIFRFAMNPPALPDNSYITKQLTLLTSYPKIAKLLTDINVTRPKYFYFDYETTGLKPHANGHKILYVSCCMGGVSYSFPLQHKDFFTVEESDTLCDLLADILINPKIVKLAHNIKMEEVWTLNILGEYVYPWGMDAMLAAHIWDNRRKFTGLKFQTYALLGIQAYDKEVKSHLIADSGNEFNTLERLSPKLALTYNARDSKYGMEVFKYYHKLFIKPENQNYRNAYTLFHNGIITFADIQENGMCMDEEHYHTQRKILTKEMKALTEKISTSIEAKEFLKTYGKPINIDSPIELGKLLFDMLSYTPTETAKGGRSVDKDVLKAIDSEFTNDILKLRQRQKIVNTFIAQFEKEAVDGVIHASFDLNIPVTYRSSSSAPNLQNISIREELPKTVLRGGLIPSKGHKILEADYSGIEVRISACVHKDANMINYILDDTTDMHRDTAADLWLLDLSQVTKQLRQSVKSGWVFPQFYGSWYKECGTNLWKECVEGGMQLSAGVSLKDHMKAHKITTLDKFIKHCKKIESVFWNERFQGYNQWKKDINKEYRQCGFTSNYFGFTFRGYMTENDVTNYPIQSQAAHCLFWSLIRIHRYFLGHDLRSKIIGQVHDSIVIDLHPNEEIQVISIINHIGTTVLHDTFDWITVPLELEFDITDVDAPWSTKKEILLNEHHRNYTAKYLVGNEQEYMQDISVWEN